MNHETPEASAFWRRLDTPGTDVARLFQTADGWRLAGTAVFLHETTRSPSRLDYALELARDWSTTCGSVVGFIGDRAVDQRIVHDASGWRLNGELVRDPALREVADLDFGFTPATNFAQVRRIQLGIGQAADFSVAWLDAGDSTLVVLPQHYERRSETRYWYVSRNSNYGAELELATSGFVRRYPELWVLETDEGMSSNLTGG